MLLRKLVSSALALVMAFGVVSALNSKDVNAANQDLSSLYADFTEVTYKSIAGGDIKVYVDGTNVGIDTNCASNILFRICDEDFHAIFDQQSSGSFSVDVADDIDVGTYYYLDIQYRAEGIDYRQWDLYITKTLEGNITFLKSLAYDFNVERCSELWTDAQSLEECLQPQNDVECDNPYVIKRAMEITAGCTNDWEKAYAIYSYIVNDFAYDFVQIEDETVAYQDDALTLMRREVAICEGMGNTFVALCRAAGVPAAVSFGIGVGDAAEMMFNNTYRTNENPNHAWACVCLDGEWYHVDPTWDCANKYEGTSFYNASRTENAPTFDWYLLPLEVFSMTHKICDADTIHGIESSGSCGSNATYEISRDGTLTIYGTGELDLPYGVNGFSRVVFDPSSNITSIAEMCFVDCDIITTIVLPDTVERIDDYAFYTCEDLEYVIIPDGCTYIGEGAFGICDELAYMYIPDTVTYIGPGAFELDGRLIVSCPSNLVSSCNNADVTPWLVIGR